METNLENLAALVTEHRRGKKRGQYPSVVWSAIAELRKHHTAEEISQATGIHQTHIYRKMSHKRRPAFREIRLSPPPVATKSIALELRRGDGAELRLRIDVDREELSTLFSEFLR